VQFLSHGTTTIEAKSGYGLSLMEELKILQAIAILRRQGRLEIVPTFLGAHDVPDEYRDAREEYIRQIAEEMIPGFARDGLASFCDVFCDVGFFSTGEAREILGAAKRAGLGLRIHTEELGHTGGALLAAEL